MKIKLVSPYGVEKEVKMGWSWTTFFFGIFPALFRGDMKWGGIMLLVNLLAVFLTGGLSSFITIPLWAAIYNKLYITDLVNKGYECINCEAEGALRTYLT